MSGIKWKKSRKCNGMEMDIVNEKCNSLRPNPATRVEHAYLVVIWFIIAGRDTFLDPGQAHFLAYK
jgi:hypothetical protein